MPPPLVSILMPTYNYGEFIERAIRSVLDQTLGDFELIVGDNASDDETESIVRRLAARDPRVRYTRRERNLGLSTNYNACYRSLDPGSRYLIGLPADDWWSPELLERLVAEAERHPEVALVHCDAYRVEQDGTIINRFTDLCDRLPAPGVHRDLATLLHNNYIPFQGCLVVRDELRRLWPEVDDLYDPDVPHANDWHLWLQLMCRGGRACYLPQPLAYFRKHPRANTVVEKLIPRMTQEVLVYEKIAASCPDEAREAHAAGYVGRLKRLGFLLLEAGRFGESLEVLARVRNGGAPPQLDLSFAFVVVRLPLPGRLRVNLWNGAVRLASFGRRQPGG